MDIDNCTTQQSCSAGATGKAGKAGTTRRVPGRRIAWRVALSTATLALLAGATTACGGAGSTSADSDQSNPTSGSASHSSPAGSNSEKSGAEGGSKSAAKGAPNSGQVDAKSASDRCTAAQLGIKLGAGDPGAGNIHYDLALTNTGSKSCALLGFPGVSLLAGDGQIIGRPATHEGQQAGSIRLSAGQSAHATLHTLNKGVKDGPCWAEPSILRVYPPGSKDAMTLRTNNPRVCGDTFTVTSLR